jgi:hypothetical protein
MKSVNNEAERCLPATTLDRESIGWQARGVCGVKMCRHLGLGGKCKGEGRREGGKERRKKRIRVVRI